jgi:hypothetical protein
MSALKLEISLANIERNMVEFAPHRKSELFNEFLVKGYMAFTLDSVPATKVSDLLRAKLCLGTLITLCDDFADRPTQANPQLLEQLYRFNFTKFSMVRSLDLRDQHVLDFAHSLFVQMVDIVKPLPHYSQLSEILNFDLTQFYSANRYSTLLTAHSYMNNHLEKRLYAHHNMGMIMAAMMDLMAIENLNFSELGSIREVLLMGQRMGRIFNVLATHNREVVDGDITGELSGFDGSVEVDMEKRRLCEEVCMLRKKILTYEKQITSFSVRAYVEGLAKVQSLHKKMEGTI